MLSRPGGSCVIDIVVRSYPKMTHAEELRAVGI